MVKGASDSIIQNWRGVRLASRSPKPSRSLRLWRDLAEIIRMRIAKKLNLIKRLQGRI